MEAVVMDFVSNLRLYLSMPVISGAVGYVTNVIAIKMMFQPLEFVGKPPLLGWQGIIPRRAAKMAAISVETITTHLMTQEEIFSRLDADKVFDMIGRHVQRAVDEQTNLAKPFVTFAVDTQTYRDMKSSAVKRLIQRLPATLKHIVDYAET